MAPTDLEQKKRRTRKDYAYSLEYRTRWYYLTCIPYSLFYPAACTRSNQLTALQVRQRHVRPPKQQHLRLPLRLNHKHLPNNPLRTKPLQHLFLFLRNQPTTVTPKNNPNRPRRLLILRLLLLRLVPRCPGSMSPGFENGEVECYI